MPLLVSGPWMVPGVKVSSTLLPATWDGAVAQQFVHLGVTKSVVLGELTPCGAGWLLPCFSFCCAWQLECGSPAQIWRQCLALQAFLLSQKLD